MHDLIINLHAAIKNRCSHPPAWRNLQADSLLHQLRAPILHLDYRLHLCLSIEQIPSIRFTASPPDKCQH